MVKGDFVFAIPGDLDTPTGGYIYDKRMIAELRTLGWRPEILNLGDGFPKPNALTLAAAKAHLTDVPKGRPIVIDGLAFGVLPEAAEALCETHPLIGLVHHPLALETGVTAEQAVALHESERAALAWVEAVTLVADSHVPDEVYEEARKHFSEKELVDLTLAIVTINGWNRISIATRAQPHVKSAKAA